MPHLSLYLANTFGSKTYVTCILYDIHSKLSSYKLRGILDIVSDFERTIEKRKCRYYLAKRKVSMNFELGKEQCELWNRERTVVLVDS